MVTYSMGSFLKFNAARCPLFVKIAVTVLIGHLVWRGMAFVDRCGGSLLSANAAGVTMFDRILSDLSRLTPVHFYPV